MFESTGGEIAPPVAATTSTAKKSFNSTKLSTGYPFPHPLGLPPLAESTRAQ